MSLNADNLGFYYNENQWLFRNISFDLLGGEILGIFGYSGCGKTSLSKVLADYLKPKEGKVLIDGKNHKEGDFKKVQLINQHPEKVMNPNWKMKEVLEESYSPDKEVMDLFGIKDDWLNRCSAELSGGELQRFSIVRALNPNTRYLIADEMTTMLDSITQAFIWKQFIKIVKKRKIGLIIISHEKYIIDKLCDNCLYLSNKSGAILNKNLNYSDNK